MRTTTRHPIRRLTAIALPLAAGALLAACGSSSSGSSTTATTASQAAATTPQGSRFSALRECLRKNGIDLPQRKGTNGSGAIPFDRGGFGGAPRLPKGVTASQYEAALKKCGGRPRLGTQTQLSKASFKKSLEAFATCMRSNGIALPTPNTSGKGPVFDTKGVNTSSPAFRSAQLKCLTVLRAARPGGAGSPPAQGAPGSPPTGQ
jgi:hypothetical protein